MGLAEITRQGIEKAIAEFDELGRDEFLQKYGFGKAKDYFLVRDGKSYDSKAIVGATHGYSGVDREPLTHDEFSGGKSPSPVVPLLESLGFTVTTSPLPQARKSRNPNWTRDELIVALDFYLQHYPNIPDKSSPEIRELSEFLNLLGQEIGISGTKTFRNENGVYMKLMNIRRLDPRYSGKGLEGGAKEDEAVWNKFYSNPNKLARLSENIRLTLNERIPIKHVSLDEDDEAEEGRLLTRQHRYRERDPKLVKRKKDQVLRKYDVLLCEVCQFNFSESYGSRGDGYIECHHTKPVSELKPGQKTKLSELSLVCSNCHRMIHRRHPWPTVNELKKMWDTAHGKC